MSLASQTVARASLTLSRPIWRRWAVQSSSARTICGSCHPSSRSNLGQRHERFLAAGSYRRYQRSSLTLYRSIEPTTSRRWFSATPAVSHGHIDPPKPGQERHVTFVDKEGQEHHFEVSDGDNLLDIAQANDLEMEGACGGSCACSTCHVIVEDEALYDKMDEPDDDENDMLDLAFGLTETSRLGCQVKMSKELDGLRVKLPSMTRNMQASDFSKKAG